jgi:hypothetical protein
MTTTFVLGTKNPNVRLLTCLTTLDEEDTRDSDYRCVVDGQHVKYVTTAPGIFCDEPEGDRNFGPTLLSRLLPTFPDGDWNKARVAEDLGTGQLAFVAMEKVALPGVENVWHPLQLNELDFIEGDYLHPGVHIATHPDLNKGGPIVIKIAEWPWEIPANEVETSVYQLIHGKGIGPKFLGHITEGKDGRVVGFALECVKDVRHAGPDDFESCKKALGRLHKLGIKHNDINKHNFLVREGYDTLLIDFEFAEQDCPSKELEEEMSGLERSLNDPSTRGGIRIFPPEDAATQEDHRE